MAEAEYVASYVTDGGNKAEFLEKFKNAMSEGFDPDVVRIKGGEGGGGGTHDVACHT